MRVTLLGCGTSSGVPRIGNDWGDCDPADPRNRRSRAAIAIEAAGTTILVDTGPDMRMQLLAAGIGWLDAVIWTHEHADHTHGIDDLRQVFHLRGSPVPGFARSETLSLLSTRFRYVFEGRHGYPPTADLQLMADTVSIGPITVKALDQPHGRISSTGLRFEHEGLAVGYATDCSRITPEMKRFYAGVDLWIVDALRRAPHPTHSHLALVLDVVAEVGASRTILTHMDHSMDYRVLSEELPPGIEPGVDGMVIDL
jgi:phosphoribosyl 1,2-cyclic phosphate phosphodiesterase